MEEARKNLSAAALKNLEKWLSDHKYAEFKADILRKVKQGDWRELEDSFCKDLDFGTSGRRGRVGSGPNRLNSITVGESAQALADYLSVERVKNPSVVIARDVRNSSPELAAVAAEVLAANDVLVYFFEDFRSTPELSFAVRELGASAGIVISASHNPPSDNGVKIYWRDGGQITAPHDRNILAIAQQIKDIKRLDFLQATNQKKIKIIGEQIDDSYHQSVLNQSVSSARDLKIVFSPLHGAGSTNLLPVLKKAGFEVEVVAEQLAADGNFSNVKDQNPNPECASANEKAGDLLLQTKADIALLTDLDADRLGVLSREKNGEIRAFSGNQAAILATNFLLEKLSAEQELAGKFICKSFVTTEALAALAAKFGVEIVGDLPVGFKYIAEEIFAQKIAGKQFLAGFEESYGGLIGDYARDKDAASFGLIIAECAAELKLKNQTLAEKLSEIYEQIGWFEERTFSIKLEGTAGMDEATKIIKNIAQGFQILPSSEATKQIIRLKTLPKSDQDLTGEIDFSQIASIMLEFEGADKTITIRPSGTEPKLKIYWRWRFAKAPTPDEIDQIIEKIKEKIDECKQID